MTDKLAELEAWPNGPLAIASIPRARNVLVLVEIARAAQDIATCKPHLLNEKRTALRAALARLGAE